MKYMLLVYSPESAWTQDEWKACTVESSKVCQDLASKGQFIAASPLYPVATAASVRVRSGKTLVTAGPFAETTEQLGGFFLIDVPNLDEAIAIAARLPSAKKGTIEVRPVATLDGVADDRFQSTGSGPRYMLISYDNEQYWNEAGPAALDAAKAEAARLTHELSARGQFITASPLHPTSTATSVRIREGKRLVTDGPFAETREFLGGFYLIHARDMNDAIAVAARHSGAPVGTVEVRQVVDLPMQN
ncbi:MAG: YciI family protein [Gemmatales bacterium]